MSHASFVHLRVHSAYSLSEGAIKPDRIAALAREAGMPAVAITDTSNLFGALEFSQYCSGRGIQPIIGCQVTVSRQGGVGDPVVLLAQDEEGLANLQRLSSAGFLTSDPAAPELPLGTVVDKSAGLLLLTGGTRGPIARLLGEGREVDAACLLAQMREAFDGRVAVELHRHGTELERAVEPCRNERVLLCNAFDARGA